MYQLLTYRYTQQNQLSKEILDQKLLDDEIDTVTESVYISDYDNYEPLPDTYSGFSPTTHRRKKKYNILPLKKIGELQADLRKAKYKKEEILQKYDISISTLMRFIHKFNKKQQKARQSKEKPFYQSKARLSQQVLSNYRAFFLEQFQTLDQKKIIYIDQVYFKKKVKNHSGKALINHPQYGFLQQVHLLVGLGQSQIVHWSLKGNKFNEKDFTRFLMDVFLKFRSHTFVMDNNVLHKDKNIRELINKLNINVLYLPPQSKDLNLIKPFFEAFKVILRPRLRDYYNVMQLMDQAHKLLTQIRDKAQSINCFKLQNQQDNHAQDGLIEDDLDLGSVADFLQLIQLQETNIQNDHSTKNNIGCKKKRRRRRKETYLMTYDFQNRNKKTDGSFSSKINVLTRGFGRVKKDGLDQQQIEDLKMDLKNKMIDKIQLQKRYNISISTLNRYIRRFKLQQIKDSLESDSMVGVKKFKERSESKVRIIEPRLIQIYKDDPTIFHGQAAKILSKEFNTPISIHVVSRCFQNIHRQEQQGKIILKGPQSSKKDHLTTNQVDQQFVKLFSAQNYNNIIFIDERVYKKEQKGNSQSWQRIYFASAVRGDGSIVHWKIKGKALKVEQIATMIGEVAAKNSSHIIALQESQMHKEDKIVQALAKCSKFIYLPLLHPQLSPIYNIFPLIVRQLRFLLKPSMRASQALSLVNQTILRLKQQRFVSEVQAAKQSIQLYCLKRLKPA